MVTKEQINRINELYKKQVEQGLSEEEKQEQAKLRRLYVDSVKESLRAQLKNIKIVTPEEYEKLKKDDFCDCHDHGCSCHDHNH